MPDSLKKVHVAAAAIVGADGRVLLTRRADETHQGGLWEFPGGKLEAGESVTAALERELREELGIIPEQSRPLICIEHSYDDLHVRLDVWLISKYSGIPEGLEGQPLQWVEKEGLRDVAMPAADKPVIDALLLPERYMITTDGSADDVTDAVQKAVAAGVRLIQLRVRSESDACYLELAQRVMEICRQADCSLMLNADPELVKKSGAGGVHLPARRLMQLTMRPLGNDFLVSASCHNRQEVMQAGRLGLDFIVLSPVLPTASHPGADVLGWDRFAELAAVSTIPVFALGGMQDGDMDVAWKHGAQGIAGIRLFREESDD